MENNGTFKWRTGRNASISNYGSNGTGDGEFYYAHGISIGLDEKIYIAERRNHRIQVLDKNGSFVRKFGNYGTAPGQFYYPADIVINQNGNLLIVDDNQDYLHYFDANGTFIKE